MASDHPKVFYKSGALTHSSDHRRYCTTHKRNIDGDTSIKAGRIVIYLLLFSGCSINYIDRVVLSVAAHPIAQEFGLSTVQLGYLFSAFLWTYLIFVLPWGMLVDRIGTKRSTAWGMAIWSFATVLTGVSGGFGSAILSRLLMGFGEASTYPAGARTIREWMPARKRGFATTGFNCGGYAGP